MNRLTASLLASCCMASAASAQDVVVMRRVLAPPTRSATTQTPTPTPVQTPTPTPVQTPTPSATPGAWTVLDDWSFVDSSGCTAQAEQIRHVACVAEGEQVDVSRCDGVSPESHRTASDYSRCTFSWEAGDWSAFSSACSDAATRMRDVSCVRSDHSVVVDESCSGAKPAASEIGANVVGCGYGWATGEFSAPTSMCGAATQTRSVTCQRTDGRTVDDSLCASQGAKPDATQGSYQTSGCGYQWSTGGWSAVAPGCGSTTQSRSVSCVRSDAQTVDDAYCADVGAKPSSTQPASDYSQCSYDWIVGSYGDWTPSCSYTATHTRTVSCERSDSTPADASLCSSSSMPASSETSSSLNSCTYTWKKTTSSGSANVYARGTVCTSGSMQVWEPYRCIVNSSGSFTSASDCLSAGGPGVMPSGAVSKGNGTYYQAPSTYSCSVTARSYASPQSFESKGWTINGSTSASPWVAYGSFVNADTSSNASKAQAACTAALGTSTDGLYCSYDITGYKAGTGYIVSWTVKNIASRWIGTTTGNGALSTCDNYVAPTPAGFSAPSSCPDIVMQISATVNIPGYADPTMCSSSMNDGPTSYAEYGTYTNATTVGTRTTTCK